MEQIYAAVMCESCTQPILLFRPSPGVSLTGPGKLRVTCPRPECHHTAEYLVAQLLHLEVRKTDLTSRTAPEPM